MTPKQRILAVYRNEPVDCVPFMLDLSHWFYHKNKMPWDLSKAYDWPETELIDYHKKSNIGFYMPNLGSFFDRHYPNDVNITTDSDGRQITWTLSTPIGTLKRTRIWEENSYSWAIRDWAIKSENDLKILAYSFENNTYTPRWEKYNAWLNAVGDHGVVYLPLGYSGMGHLLNYWMGIEQTMFAAVDWPDTVRDTVSAINNNLLTLIDLFCQSPADIIIMGDNFSGDVQPPRFFQQWSADFYKIAIEKIHAAGKFVAVHIDGKLNGSLAMIRDIGADAADAVTPAPVGDLTPAQCRMQAGAHFILSGGPGASLWLPETPLEQFKKAVLDWLNLKKNSTRVIANAGDQVPPNADEDRISIMHDLVAQHGTY